MVELARRIEAEIAGTGPMRFSRYMERALYEPDLGFYARGGRAGGRQGDFVTSVETGTLFAALIGEWLDRCWDELGRPDPYLVVEAGAGVGTLWRGIHRAAPRCANALAYALVERSEAQRAGHADLPAAPTSTAEVPAGPVHVVFANELLDNLAIDIVGSDGERWMQVEVTGDADEFRLTEGSAVAADHATALPPPTSVPAGSRLPWPIGANAWLGPIAARADITLCLDYAATTAQLAERGIDGWLRTYDGHRSGADPLATPGAVDITHDVPFELLTPAPTTVRRQADFLRELGIERRVDAARAEWEARRHVGDLDALFARSWIGESEALLDPTGLGDFSVLEWRRR